MAYCSICRYDIAYNDHWGSRYRQATFCKFCREEGELEFLPEIIGRIVEIEWNMKECAGRFHNLADVNFVNENLECSFYNPSRTAWLEVDECVKTQSEFFFWNQFNQSNILECPGYIQEHEFELLKQYLTEYAMFPFKGKC